MDHIDDHDLERYHLGMIRTEAELAPFEEHLLACTDCPQVFSKPVYEGTILGGMTDKCPWVPRFRQEDFLR